MTQSPESQLFAPSEQNQQPDPAQLAEYYQNGASFDQLQAMGYSPDEITAMAATYGPEDLTFMHESGIAPPQAEEAAVKSFSETLKSKWSEESNPNDPATTATESLWRDGAVAKAKQEIEAAFPADAKAVEQSALEQVIKQQGGSEDSKNIAATVLAGGSPTAETSANNLTEDTNSQRNYDQLKDKVNGSSQYYVERIARKTREQLRGLGLRGSTIQKLGNEALQTGGAELTKTDRATEAEDTAIGEEVVRSITGGKPKMSTELRNRIKSLGDKGQLNTLRQAVANRGRSRGTLRRVGKQLRGTLRSGDGES